MILCIFVDGICETCSGETDGTGTIVDNDADDDGVCDADEIAGCQDATACNYNENATDDDGSCIFVDGICETCSGETDGTGTIVDNDADDDGVCDADEIAGCQDATACNYNENATDDDGSCIFVDGICETCSGETDGTGTIVDNDADDDGVCDADEIAGCQDATACNYNENATEMMMILVYIMMLLVFAVVIVQLMKIMMEFVMQYMDVQILIIKNITLKQQMMMVLV